MELLPEEMRCYLFDFLPYRDQNRIWFTCKSWRKFISEYDQTNRKKFIKVKEGEMESILFPRGKAIGRIHKLTLDGIVNPDLQHIGETYGFQLHSLHIVGGTCSFPKFLRNSLLFSNLKKLTLTEVGWMEKNRGMFIPSQCNSSRLHSLRLTAKKLNARKQENLSSYSKWFPNVKILLIKNINVMCERKDMWGVESLLLHNPSERLLTSLEEMQLPKVFDMTVSTNNLKDFPRLEDIFKFLSLFHNQLTSLKLESAMNNSEPAFINCTFNLQYNFPLLETLACSMLNFKPSQLTKLFPNLKIYSTYFGSYEEGSADFVESKINELVITNQSVFQAISFTKNVFFKNVTVLSLNSVWDYSSILPHVFVNMTQLETLQIMGSRQCHWLNDSDLTGYSLNEQKKIICKTDWIRRPRQYSLERIGLRFLRNLKVLHLHCQVSHVLTDFSVMYGIVVLSNLERLTLTHAPITFGCASRIMEMENLEYLDVKECPLLNGSQLCKLRNEMSPNLDLICSD